MLKSLWQKGFLKPAAGIRQRRSLCRGGAVLPLQVYPSNKSSQFPETCSVFRWPPERLKNNSPLPKLPFRLHLVSKLFKKNEMKLKKKKKTKRTILSENTLRWSSCRSDTYKQQQGAYLSKEKNLNRKALAYRKGRGIERVMLKSDPRGQRQRPAIVFK